MADIDENPPSIAVDPADKAPVSQIRSEVLKMLGDGLMRTFEQYASDRQVAEQKWLRNLRQYLGVYDPDIEKMIPANRSRAYPRVTRVKCISVLSRIMNLMFPGNERNWEVKASPSPDMAPDDVMEAIKREMAKQQQEGVQVQMTDELIGYAVKKLADERAEALALLIDDQLQEIGGDQTMDYIALNRKVAASGIMFGLGVLRGPFVITSQRTKWEIDPATQQPVPKIVEGYKPMFEFLPVWDFYPDMSSKTLVQMDGWFSRAVMSKSQLRALANRSDFFGDQIKAYLMRNQTGNYKPRTFETELRTMGVKVNVNDQKTESGKYEILVWHGPISAQQLVAAGADVPKDKMADDIEAEVWMVEGTVIKADINQWRKIGVEVRTIHPFLFDEDDTSPVGTGLPAVVRDSQMSISATTRMLLDNASSVCGPNLELNTELLRPDQDITNVHAYKIWYREGTGPDAQFPAVRNVVIESHMDELLKAIDLFMRFADMETFVGPATGGDMSKAPSEPMRTAAGASMLRGDASLPFKDIVRNFDSFTQSVIYALVLFNKKFNPDRAKPGDYNVIARGATSLIAKEIRGIQVDSLAMSLTDGEKMHVDDRKLVEARFAVRDMSNMLLPMDDVMRKQAANQQMMQAQNEQQQKLTEANVRKLLSDALKNIAQAQKNSAAADATTAQAALDIMEKGLNVIDGSQEQGGSSGSGSSGA
jgi:hypothetical protein